MKKGEDVVNLSLHVNRILRISQRDNKTNTIAACDLITNCVQKLSIEDQSCIFALTQTCVGSFPNILRMHLLELSATLSENHLGGEAAYNAAEGGSSAAAAAASLDDISAIHNYPLTGCSVLLALLSNDRIQPNDGFLKQKRVFVHALRENEENDDLLPFYVFTCIASCASCSFSFDSNAVSEKSQARTQDFQSYLWR